MKKNKINFAVLKPKYIYKILIKEIKLILFISLVSTLCVLFLNNKKAHTFNIHIVNLKYFDIENFWLKNKIIDYEKIFIEQFKSPKNIKTFINKSNKSSNKKFILEDYKIKEKIVDTKYYITFFGFNELSDVEIYFNDYIKFINNISFKKYQNYVTRVFNAKISEYENALKIAQVIKLDKPNLLFGDGKIILNYNEELFYKGTDVLKTQIIQLKEKLQTIKNLKESDIEYELNPQNTYFDVDFRYVILNILLLSLFSSVVIIYLKYKFYFTEPNKNYKKNTLNI